jgi:glycine cleavage system H protein
MQSVQLAGRRRYIQKLRPQEQETKMSYPTDRKYTKEHEWITADGAIGITSHAQDSLGDIVFVELPKLGAELTAGKAFGTVESVNEGLITSPEQVNKDAHGAWMVKIKVKDPAEMNTLLSAADYDRFVTEEGGH